MTIPAIDVDLYSDTVTRPTREMRRFMCDAEVGDALDPATVETNIVIFELRGAIDVPSAVAALRERGVRMGAMSARTIRAVTHLDVSAEQIERALDTARAVFRG